MSVVKATAVAPNTAARNSMLADAQAAAASFQKRPERDATVELAPEVSPLAMRVKVIAINDTEGTRIYNLLETRMVAVPVQPGSFIRLTLDNGTLGNSREW